MKQRKQKEEEDFDKKKIITHPMDFFCFLNIFK